MTALTDDLLGTADCLIVVNPAAALVGTDAVAQITERMAERTRTLCTVWTTGPGHAAELVRSSADLVVAVGGDGTVHEIAQALTRDQVLCPLPVGSGNSVARNLFGDRDWQQVLDILEPGGYRVQQLDLLRIREAEVAAVLGVASGFLAEVLVRARTVDAGITGLDRYYVAAADVLAEMPNHPTRVSVDGVVVSDGPASSVAVGGGRFRARHFQFLPESILDDGLLDVSTIDALDAAAATGLAPLLPTGGHLGRPDVHYARGRTVVIERTDGMPLVAEFDGTVWDAATSRLTIDVLPQALRALSALD